MDNKILVANTDREMLDYLMQAFDNEMGVCERCGHEESTATMDSAGFLRDYLATYPATEAKPSASAAPGIDTPEFWPLLAACGDYMTAPDREQEYATARAALVAHIDAAIAAAREEGRQEAERAALHQSMQRAFPGKSHAEIAAEIERATGAAPHPQAK